MASLVKANRVIQNLITLATVPFVVAAVFIGCVLASLRFSFWMILFFFGIVILLMHGINNVVTSMSPLYMREKMNPGKMAGILNGCCYAGSTLSSYIPGWFADHAGWSSVFVLFIITAVFAVALGATTRLILGDEYSEKRKN